MFSLYFLTLKQLSHWQLAIGFLVCIWAGAKIHIYGLVDTHRGLLGHFTH